MHGNSNIKFLEPSGPLQVCNGTALPFYLRNTHPLLTNNVLCVSCGLDQTALAEFLDALLHIMSLTVRHTLLDVENSRFSCSFIPI